MSAVVGGCNYFATRLTTPWFSDRPYRHAFTQSTAEFVAGFGKAFSARSGSNPNAVLNWEDAITGDEKSVVLELLAVDAS